MLWKVRRHVKLAESYRLLLLCKEQRFSVLSRGRRFIVAGPHFHDLHLVLFRSSLGTPGGSARLLSDHIIQRGHRDGVNAVRMGVWVRVDDPDAKVRDMTS